MSNFAGSTNAVKELKHEKLTALMKKVRTNNTIYCPGDTVWYKKTDEDKWDQEK